MKICMYFISTTLSLLPVFSPAQQTSGTSKQNLALPIIPVAYDAYLRWDQWPLQRIGNRAYMRSTYDRTGGNAAADMSNFLFMKEENDNVTLDVSGMGAMYFFRFNFWHGSPWRFVVDGKSNVVQESATADPINARSALQKVEFIPRHAFHEPLSYTWKTTKGADLIWTPIPFRSSFQLAYGKTAFGTGYYIYHLYANEEQLSQPIRSWEISDSPHTKVVSLLQQAGTDIAPKNIATEKGSLLLNKRNVLIKEIKAKSSVIRALKFSLPLQKAIDLERIRLKVTWDGTQHASIDAPLCLLFGAGTLYNRDNREFLVKGFPVNIQFDTVSQKVELACYYPMPFMRSAKFELTGVTPQNEKIEFEIRYEPLSMPFSHTSYFHATYKDFPQPEYGKDLELLDTKGIEGKNEWSGNFAGTSLIFSHGGVLRGLEGDPRFFFDDSESPQAYGTGTEEWGGGGFYWGGENMTLPLAGHPCGAPSKDLARHPKDLIESCYRFLLADIMPFGKRAVIRLEHGGENLATEHYEAVTYWYGLPAASLIKTDSLDIGNIDDEKKHDYHSPEASSIEKIYSRYEWGIDSFPDKPWPLSDTLAMRRLPKEHLASFIPPDYDKMAGKEIHPMHQEDGRTTKGTTEWNASLLATNRGVLLRRKLDYSYPNQKAAVYVAPVIPGKNENELQWKYAGEWYLAGSNTYVFSRPGGELDARQYNVLTSHRVFREDEFLIPEKLTRDQTNIRIRLKFLPVDQKLFPGHAFPKDNKWSELRYDVYSYCLPAYPD
jgi:hypothetical protein